MLTKAELHDLFEYSDGNLYWRHNKRGSVKAGDKVGATRKDGYVYTKISGGRYLVHRLIYAWHTGEWPALIDHKDTDPSNNRIDNLRPLSQTDNHHNTDKTWGRVGVRGVSLDKGRYRARISRNQKEILIGYYATADEAADAYNKHKKEKQYGFQEHNRSHSRQVALG